MAQRFNVASVNITDRQTDGGVNPEIIAGRMGMTANPIKPQEFSPAEPAATPTPGGM